jgi:hypothetical protein
MTTEPPPKQRQSNTVRNNPVTKLNMGGRIALTAADFVHLATGFPAEIGHTFR